MDYLSVLERSGRGEGNSVEVGNLGADAVVNSVTASTAVGCRRRRLVPEATCLASLVVDGKVDIADGWVLGGDQDNGVFAVLGATAADALAGEAGGLADEAVESTSVALELEVDRVDDVVVLA